MSEANNSREKVKSAMKGNGAPMRGPGARFTRAKEKPKNTKVTIKRLFGYLMHSKVLVIALLIVALIYTAAGIYSSVLIKDVAGALGTYNSEAKAWVREPNEASFYYSLWSLLITYVVYCVFLYLSSLFGAFLAAKTVRKMRNDLFEKIVYLPISYLDSHFHGDLLSRMTNDVDNISNVISSSITSLISGVLTILGCLGVMLWHSPLLTLISFVVLILTLIYTKLMSKYARPLFVKQQGVLGALNTQTEEMVTGYKTVITNNHEAIAIEEFSKYSDDFTHTAIKAQVLGSSMGPIMNFIGNIGYFLVCICGALFIVHGIGGTIYGEPLTIAIVIMFLTTTKQFTRPINEVAMLYSSIVTALAGAERVFSVMDEEVENFNGTLEFKYDDVKGEIDFLHIDFGYEENELVLKDFSMHVDSGHKVALVGATGSGKTTIVNLLLRYYDPNSGKILIDGKDTLDISKKDLRDAISIVLQDPVLFGDTIENNVKYGKKDATDEEVDFALTFANCDSFINNLPDGKKTILTEGATNISQGQRQLLTIARAVLADPRILILDEATSSVDTRTEKKVQDAMVKLMANRTSIIIAHRLSTIQDANRIIVLDKGHVVEEGTHKELLAINGVYRKLYETQFKGLDT
ncbi:ATP-binding cassette subfamily B protein [Anaeroplasma bactoclasticum]|jgi:ATP-binding cassette subfamily B protein|uniref:ATP-binding cassette subfamily B protein n=1 Tax=Anaeroplasma bactoclasticum TaxID=2088 RepID=A0A397S2H8_9MOLU|nr:ABC transporter ATP-binding protein [Anaeroplasma bactoclasticum]RIA78585.1 ATP-binding cassette subfamily B protein [Anaeroplasma bactoclasticum]